MTPLRVPPALNKNTGGGMPPRPLPPITPKITIPSLPVNPGTGEIKQSEKEIKALVLPGEETNVTDKCSELKKTIKDIQNKTNEPVKVNTETELTEEETETDLEQSSSKAIKDSEEPTTEQSEQEANDAEKPEKKTSRKRKSKEESETPKLETTTTNFQQMENAVCNTFSDPEWEAEKEAIALENARITIDEDMNPTSLKQKVAQLCALRDRIYFDYCKYQTNYQNLSCDKPEGIIERVKRVSAKGSNDFERRGASTLACMQYKHNGELINLYELLDQTRARYYFYKAIMDNIEWKSKTIITMNSAILMEQKLDK